MNTTDSLLDPRWGAARTLADLGELTALWLERDGVTCHPGYGDWEGDPGPDDETAEIVGPLAAANRAGYVTTNSQPGYRGDGVDPDNLGSGGTREWTQRAAVTGYATIATRDRLRAHLPLQSLIYIDQPLLLLPRQRYTRHVPVTWCEGTEYTWFGHRAGIRDLLLDFSSRSWRLNTRLAAARQITIIDQLSNRNTVLWPLLSEFGGAA